MDQVFIVELLAAYLRRHGVTHFESDQLASKAWEFFDGLHLIDWSRVEPMPEEDLTRAQPDNS